MTQPQQPFLFPVFVAAGSLLLSFVIGGLWHLFVGQRFLGSVILTALGIAAMLYQQL